MVNDPNLALAHFKSPVHPHEVYMVRALKPVTVVIGSHTSISQGITAAAN